jgi:uncharacterized protein (DUF924 family)
MLQPLEHSENVQDQELCVQKFNELVISSPLLYQDWVKEGLKYALEHYEAIKRFGRYPHRNQVLERESTPEEIEFLNNGANRYGQ